MIMESLGVLDENGIAHVGAGANWAEARKPVVLTKKGTRFGFLSYSSVFFPVGHAAQKASPGIATVKGITYYQPHPRIFEMPGAPATTVSMPDPEELEFMKADIRKLKPKVDVLVVAFHWGISGSQETAMYQVTLGHEAIDCGADLVFGQHPHTPQAVEVYKEGAIFYSLGNFVFDWVKMAKARDGLLLRCLIENKAAKKVSFVPVRRNDEGQPRILDLNEGHDIVTVVTELSHKCGTQLQCDNGEVVVFER
jgi:poly-gamma-glutamate synthesis protein (capsule biosynthesis protein)